MPRESAITKSIIDLFNQIPGSWWMKKHGSAWGRRGVPDVFFVFGGRFFAFEVKQPGEQPTRLQRIEASKLRMAGAIAQVVHSANDVRSILSGAGVPLP